MGQPVTLYTIPFAGGGAGQYLTWSAQLPAWVRVVPARLPGRERRLAEPALTSIEANADHLATHDRAEFSSAPLALFGQSMGALIAHELARRLPRTAALLVASSPPPDAPGREAPLHRLPGALLMAALRRMGGPVPSEELFVLMEPTIRADLAACETYQPSFGAPLNCPVVAFAGADDPLAAPQRMLDWRKMTTGPFTLHVVAGGHFHPQESRATFLARLGEALRPLHRPPPAERALG